MSVPNNFHGWWLLITKGQFFGVPNTMSLNATFPYPSNSIFATQTPSYLFIDTLDVKGITVYFFAGNVKRQRDPIVGVDGLIKVISEKWEIVSDNVLRLKDPFNSYKYGYYNDTSFTIQTEGLYQGYMYQGDQEITNGLGGFCSTGSLLQKIPGFSTLDNPPTPIRPWPKDNPTFPNVNDRVFMFKQLLNATLTMYAPTTESVGAEDYVGRNQRLLIEEQLLTTGIQRSIVNIIKIKKTTNINKPSTTIITDKFSGVNPAAKVTISGLKSPWDILNGTHSVLINDITNYDPMNSPKGNYYINSKSLEYRLTIPVDTSMINEEFTQKQGKLQVKKFGPVTPVIEYQDFIAAYWEYWNQIFNGTIVHSSIGQVHNRICYPLNQNFDPIGIPTQIVETWNQVKDIFKGSKFPSPNVVGYGGYSLNNARCLGPIGSMFYINAFMNFSQLDYYSDAWNIQRGYFPLNESFKELNAFEIPGSYQIAKNNYLDPNSIRYLWWRINPNTPVTLTAHSQTKKLYNPTDYMTRGLNYQGSKFEGFISPIGPEVVFDFNQPAPTAPDGGMVSPFNSTYEGYLPDRHFFGLINPNYTNGEKVGYWRLSDMYGLLDPYGIQFSPMFGTTNSPLRSYEANLAVLVPMIKYFNSNLGQNKKLILDIRCNQGGLNRGWVHMFGGDRNGPVQNLSFSDHEEIPALNHRDVEIWGGYAETDAQAGSRTVKKAIDMNTLCGLTKLLPSEVKRLFGNDAVFENGTLIILTDSYAYSAGEEILHFFAGDKGDGDIGGGVKVSIVGELDGRLMGYAGGPENHLELSQLSSEFRDKNGNAIPPVWITTEGPDMEAFGDLFACRRNGLSFMLPVGGPLSNKLEDTVYLDFGHTTPHTNPISKALPNFPNGGQPIKSDKSTYRDQWLEYAIRVLLPKLSTSGSRPLKYVSSQSKYQLTKEQIIEKMRKFNKEIKERQIKDRLKK